MHPEILNEEQKKLLPLIKQFKKDFYLVGGTAIALHIGHRLSIDFDLFIPKPFSTTRVAKKVSEQHPGLQTLYRADDQIHFAVNGVKITFFYYPFPIPATEKFDSVISFPSLKVLAAMKAFALGGRGKWKDYVDLYFLLKHHFDFETIAQTAEDIYGTGIFNRKLFKEQLSFFKDINYDELVDYMPGFEVSEDEVKSFLTEVSTHSF